MRNMRFVRLNGETVKDCIRGWISSFPPFEYKKALKIAKEQVDELCFFGAYEDNIYKGLIVGADTKFNFRGKVLNGFELDHLHVEPMYRKSDISKYLIMEFQKYAQASGYFMTNVGPFSTEFYRNMGYGFGAKILKFKSKPLNFMYYSDSRNTLEYYDGVNRRQELEAFITTERNNYHGSFNFKDSTLKSKFDDMRDKNHITVLSIVNDSIRGALSYEMSHNIIIEDFLFSSPIAAQALSSYLHSLHGNIDNVEIKYAHPGTLAMCNRPYDINLIEESMVKLLNLGLFIQAIKDVEFENIDISIRFNLNDALLNYIDTYVIEFRNGHMGIGRKDEYDVEVDMELSDFTTMLFSQNTFKTYVQIGLARVSDIKKVMDINKIFSYGDVPYNI